MHRWTRQADSKPIPSYLLDNGSKELGSGLSYVGASRAMAPGLYAVADTENGFAFPSEKRFNNGENKKETVLHLRQQETRRLEGLSQRTHDREDPRRSHVVVRDGEAVRLRGMLVGGVPIGERMRTSSSV